MTIQIQLRRGTALEWMAADPILAEGEMGLEKDTGKFKVGNGIDHWTGLPYSSGPHGLSAYQVAVQNGYVGTETDWLATLIGPQGIQGIQGPQGDQGIAGLIWRGDWSQYTAYTLDDAVSDQGSAWVCLQAHTNQRPPNTTYWQLLASKGSDSNAITVADVTPTQAGLDLLGAASVAAQHTALGLGDAATRNTGVALGVATLDASGKLPASQLPSSVMEYKGTWDASINSPVLADGTGDAGDTYRVSVAGTQNLGSGSISFEVGDLLIYSGTIWQKSDTTDSVISVDGLQGAVNLSSRYIAMADKPASAIVGASDVQTLTNKRVVRRPNEIVSSATPTPSADVDDDFVITALAVNATIGAPTGTPTSGQVLIMRIKDDGTSRVLTWNAIYRAVGTPLPSTTAAGKTMYLGFKYNAADTKWDLLAFTEET